MAHLRNAIVAMLVVSLAGCTSLAPIEDFSPSRILARVEVGDDVRIVARNGAAYELEVTSIGAAELEGRAASGKKYRVPFEAIRSIEVEEGDAVKTVGSVLASLYVVASALFIYAMYALAEATE